MLCFVLDFKFLGIRYGASVSIINLSLGINFNNEFKSAPLRSSQTHPVIPMYRPKSKKDNNSLLLPVKQ